MSKVQYIFSILKYGLRSFPGIYFCFILTVISVGIELLAMSSLMPLSSLLTDEPVDDAIISRILTSLNLPVESFTLLMAFIVLFMTRIFTQMVVNGLNVYYSREFLGHLSSSALKTVMRNFSLPEIEKKSIGYFTTLAGDEANRASQILLNLLSLVGTLTLSVFYGVAIFLYSAKTFYGLMIFFAVCLVILSGVFIKSYRLGQLQIEGSKKTNSIFIDAMSHIRMIRSFKSETYVTDQYQSTLGAYMRTMFKIDFLNLASKLLPVFIVLAFAGGYFYVERESIRSGINLAFFITIIFYLLRFFPAVGMCLTSSLRIVSDAKAGKDIVAVVSRSGEKDARPINDLETIKEISFNNVCFSYDEKKTVLNDFTFNLQAGKSYALVGPSGAGKSTLANLLLGFYDAGSGEILLGDKEIQQINRQCLRGKILLLSQKTVAFNDSIYHNVVFGQEEDRPKVWEALEKVDLRDVVENLENGLDTVLNYQGTNLSGGQLQRIGIARAFLRNSDVLIFDESFSGLDSVTKLKVLDNIKEFSREKILIFISHDQEVVNLADEVIDLGNSNPINE